MREIGVHEAKTHFSDLLRRVAAGEEVLIRKGDRVVAKVIPWPISERRAFGHDRGRIHVADDFDAPLTDDELAAAGLPPT